MDALDRLAGPAHELLVKVDDALAHAGAPAVHPLWPLVRRIRVLPAEAVTAVAALDPAPLLATAESLRSVSGQCARVRVPSPDWQGPAAESFTAHWAALSAYVEQGLADRLVDTASFAEAVAAWMGRTRLAVARTIATVLGSAEAVTIECGGDAGRVSRAAADIGVWVLATVAGAYAEAEELLAQWSGRLGELPFTPSPLPAVPPITGSIGVAL